VDFEPSDDQQQVLDAVEVLLERHAGAARAVALNQKADYDRDLDAHLQDAGFLEVGLGEATGFLDAELVVEAVARAGGVVSVGASALVAPAVAGRVLPGPVAVAAAGETAPIRFGAHARTLLLDDGDQARVLELSPGDAQPVRSNFMLPMGRLEQARTDPGRGESLGPGSGERLRAWWRVGIAAEIVGTMDAALAVTLDYVKRRHQFGRAIGSFQAIQHRLAECAVAIEGGRWLAREAAAKGAPREAAATAAAHATAAASRVFAESHQFHGAMGFTREHDLHVWSMRLQALRLEAGGVGAHCRETAEARWVSP
jgi:alkylation response protein AidB-like acyl-CoA dehydrogenase